MCTIPCVPASATARGPAPGEMCAWRSIFGMSDGRHTTGAAGEINYHKLQRGYLRAVKGSRKPNIGLTNKSCWGFIAEKVRSGPRPAATHASPR